MLKRFEVKNYEGFRDLMVWDLSSTRSYSDYKNLIKNKISKNSIVYGKNGSGKSCLCSAIMDITSHLLDVQKDTTPFYRYSYIGNEDKTIEFKYTFLLDKKEVVYQYKEVNTRDLLIEQLFVDGKEIKMQVTTGQKVIYSKYAGTEVKLDGEEYIIVRQNDILAVVE